MARQRRPTCGNTIAHGTSVGAPHSSPLMKLPMRPAARPSGTSGATKSVTSSQRLLRAAREEPQRDQHAEQAAVEAHAALPDVRRSRADARGSTRLVEQHVAEPAAEDHAEHAVEQHVVDVASRASRVSERADARACRPSTTNSTKPTRYMRPYQRTASGPDAEGRRIELRDGRACASGTSWTRCRNRAMRSAQPSIIRATLRRPPSSGGSPHGAQPPLQTHHRRASPARPTARCCAPWASATAISTSRSSASPTATRTMNPCNAGIQPLVDRAMAALQRRRRDAAGVRRADGHRRHRHGHRRHEVLARVARGDRRRDRDLGQRPVHGRRARRRRLRQEHAGRHDGDGAHERARRSTSTRGTIKPGNWKGQDLTIVIAVRGGRRVHRRQDVRRRTSTASSATPVPASARAAACTRRTRCPRRSRRSA